MDWMNLQSFVLVGVRQCLRTLPSYGRNSRDLSATSLQLTQLREANKPIPSIGQLLPYAPQTALLHPKRFWIIVRTQSLHSSLLISLRRTSSTVVRERRQLRASRSALIAQTHLINASFIDSFIFPGSSRSGPWFPGSLNAAYCKRRVYDNDNKHKI